MSKKVLYCLILYPILASIISFSFNISAFNSVLLFLFVPSLFLTILNYKSSIKALIFSFVAPVPAIIFFDYIAHINGQWLIPESIINYRFLGIVTIEVVLWMFLMSYFIVMFYEYFLDKKDNSKIWNSKMTKLTSFFFSVFFIFLVVYFLKPSLLLFSYAYLWIGVIFLIIPLMIELFRKPHLANKYFYLLVFFFYYTIFYEISALKLGWWSFPAKDFIGWVTIYGITFPLEEFFFWLVLAGVSCISYYEFFDDDEK